MVSMTRWSHLEARVLDGQRDAPGLVVPRHDGRTTVIIEATRVEGDANSRDGRIGDGDERLATGNHGLPLTSPSTVLRERI